MATADPAGTAAWVYAALTAGHWIGDHVITRDAAMSAKALPTGDRLAAGVHPWTGWRACAEHVAGYGLAQAVALGVASVAAPLTFTGGLVALIISASTHAVIDRRWIVQAIIRAKRCQDWTQGPYLIDQALHYAVLLVAATLAARVHGASAVAVAAAAGVALVAAAMAIERRSAGTAATGVGDPTRP
jgi:hypothetical protein